MLASGFANCKNFVAADIQNAKNGWPFLYVICNKLFLNTI